jgi:hypothetical protein
VELAYAVADSNLHVIDTDAMTIITTKNLSTDWTPTDTLATFIPFGGTIRKTCISHPNGKFYKGDTVVFNLSIQNRHALPIGIMPARDTYDNTQLHFVSSSYATEDTVDDGVINWADLIASAGQTLQTGAFMDVTVTFTATEDCQAEIITGLNVAEIINVEDDTGMSLPDALDDFEYEIDCNCRTNYDCDDGEFCTGMEICLPDGSCDSPGNPCPLDDGQFCTGTETEECDEELDECGHEDLPCEDDGDWCNGTDSCNEDTDTCLEGDAPCADDGQFCNGKESCDEDADECLHGGEPCAAGEECNEAIDQCTATDPGEGEPSDDPLTGEEELWPEGKVTGGCCGCSD